MKPLKIVGVPEHFNLPWQLCFENKDFEAKNINLHWTNVPEGTGKMCQMLRDAETDIAIILTEGIVKDIAAGNDSSIVQVYVKSQLIWGIHVDNYSNYHYLNDLENTKIAISRYGSGSHLMAFVNAENQGWKTDSLQFEIVNTIDGAVKSLSNGKSDYFMWEKFMTKPLVDANIFRKIADCPTPWPSFVIAVRNEILEKYPNKIKTILEIINNKTFIFKQIENIDQKIANHFNLKIDDVQQWLSLTEWSQENLDKIMLDKIQNQLFDLKIIDKKRTFAEIVKAI